MGFFLGEGLDLNFPLGGGTIFQPRGGPGGGLRSGIFNVQMMSFTISMGYIRKCGASRNFFAEMVKIL